MIFKGSRYEDADFGSFQWEGSQRRTLPFNPRMKTIDDIGRNHIIYETSENDALDALAQKYSGDFEKFHLIAEINNIPFPLESVGSGTALYIPTQQFFNSGQSENFSDLVFF